MPFRTSWNWKVPTNEYKSLSLGKVEGSLYAQCAAIWIIAWVFIFQKPLMLVGGNGGLLDGIVELLEHCLSQVCSFILVFCFVFQVCSNEHVEEIM